MGLSDSERARTARQLALDGFGTPAQERLAGGHVAVIGAGGLGSPAILALAAAGVGTLTVIDDDVVERSNLHRQVIHRTSDIGAAKVASAVRAAAEIAPEAVVHAVCQRLTAANAPELLRDADVVLDGSDTFATREAVAAACERLGLPLVWGAVQGYDAQVTVFWTTPPEGEPVRLSDLYPPGSDAPSCAEVGVLGTVCLQVGALMATEAVKVLTGVGEPLIGRVLVLDGLRARHTEVALRPAPARSATPLAREWDAATLTAALASDSPPVVLDVREAQDAASDPVPGAVRIPLEEVLAEPPVWEGSVVVVCRAGVRARHAAAALTAAGVDAVALAGGIRSWRREVPA